MTDKKKSEPDPDIIPPERNERTQAKSEAQTIEARPRRRVTSSLVLVALLLVLGGMVLLRFDLVRLPQFDFGLAKTPDVPAPVPAVTVPPEPQDDRPAAAASEPPIDLSESPDVSSPEPASPPQDLLLDAEAPKQEPLEPSTSASATADLRQALLILRVGDALTPVWDDLQAALPATALEPLREHYDQPAMARDHLMLAIADWWSTRQTAAATRLDTGLPALLDSALNSMITVRPHAEGDRVAESFRHMVARGDIAGALGQWNGLSLADQQQLSDWRQAAKLYQARQALINLLQEQMQNADASPL